MKKLRRKIVLGVFLSATVVFALTILFVGLGLDIQEARRADAMTEELVKHGGKMPKMTEPDFEEFNRQLDKRYFGEETVFRLRYFTVSDENGTLQTDLTYIASVDEEKALALAQTVRSGDSATGYQDGFRYRISSDGDLIVFLDNSDDIAAIRQLVLILFIVSIFFIVMITLVFWFLSKRIVKPFEENARMQKQFITDASHELKTPLAIISANAEVLAYKDGENEWIENITSQVSRVSELVNELLILNRLEEVEEISDIEPVDMSQKANAVADSFAEVFKSKNAALVRDIRPDVILNGNPPQLERLISVLTENASKYVSENGEVKITLKKEPRYTYMTFFNTCELDKDADYSQLFDRFYRPDASRASNTGGHGVGLSIAKRIVTLHNGSIEAVPCENGLAFNVKLSNRLKPRKSSLSHKSRQK